jgi:hypothetical protein
VRIQALSDLPTAPFVEEIFGPQVSSSPLT